MTFAHLWAGRKNIYPLAGIHFFSVAGKADSQAQAWHQRHVVWQPSAPTLPGLALWRCRRRTELAITGTSLCPAEDSGIWTEIPGSLSFKEFETEEKSCLRRQRP